jgi:rSAM/selenodomain-associated transferase 1
MTTGATFCGEQDTGETLENKSVLLFVKSPRKGAVKSRLAATLGETAAQDIYKSFVLDILKTLISGRYPLRIFFYPPDARAEVTNWLGKSFVYMPQRGEDLGARMADAFVQSFSEGLEKLILIGSDVPDLTEAIIDEAFKSLQSNDAVIGPASDGGYYLIGFNKGTFLPDIFTGLMWSTSSIFRQTMKVLQESGCSVHILPECSDVDTVDDLRSFFIRNKDVDFRTSYTLSSLMRNKVAIIRSEWNTESRS